jgi:hypothetical protein
VRSSKIDLIDLRFLRCYSKYLTTDHRQRRARKGGSTEIRPGELMTTWVYDEKFLMGMRFLFEMLSFTVREDNDLEHPTQEQEERRMMTTGFEFPQGLNNSATTFQPVARQPAMTNPIDSLARPPIETPLMTIRSSGLALCEIRTTKPKESAWLDVAIGKRSIPPVSTQRSTGP